MRCFLFLRPNYTIFSVFFLFALFSEEPQVFLPEYSQPTILHAANFWRVVNPLTYMFGALALTERTSPTKI